MTRDVISLTTSITHDQYYQLRSNLKSDLLLICKNLSTSG